jgi:hypothetical protein
MIGVEFQLPHQHDELAFFNGEMASLIFRASMFAHPNTEREHQNAGSKFRTLLGLFRGRLVAALNHHGIWQIGSCRDRGSSSGSSRIS